MSVQPQLSEQAGAGVRLVALYRNARQPIRRLTNVLTLLGRGEACDIILSSSSVGVAHAAIVRLGSTAYICDLGAPGGTQLDGRYVRWARLQDGAELVLGRFRFRIELEGGDLAIGAECPTFSLTRGDDTIATTVEDPLLIVGSAEGCDVLATDPTVAGRHALVVWSLHGPIVRDLSTQSGTRHNGRKITIARLLSGDTIGVGGHELTFKIDMTTTATDRMGLTALLGGASSQDAVEGLIAGRLAADQLPRLDELFPSPQTPLTERGVQAETQRDLSLLKDAARSLAEGQARLESSFDGASLLAGLDHPAGSIVETGSGILGVAAAPSVVMAAQASAGGESKPDEKAASDRLLESTMRLQTKRDQDKRRAGRPARRADSVSDIAAAPPFNEGGIGLDDTGISAAAFDDGDGGSGRIAGPAAAPHAAPEEGVRDAMWQKAAARLEMELTEAREELKRVKAKYAQHMELHGSLEARNRRLDQRIAELRSRVAGAQEALDERARTLRSGLEAERERLRQQHLDIQRKSDELDQVALRQKEDVQRAFESERAGLEQARADLQAERDALAALRAEFESRHRQSTEALERSLAERETAFQKQIEELNDRQRSIEQAAAEDNQRREAAFAWRENELAERRKTLEQEIEQRARQMEEELLDRRAGVDAQSVVERERLDKEFAAARAALDQEFAAARTRAVDELNAEKARVQDEIAQARAEFEAWKRSAEGEFESNNRVRIEEVARRTQELNQREAEFQTRRTEIEARLREAAAAIEETRKRDEETLVGRQAALEDAFRVRVRELEDAAALRLREIEARRQALDEELGEQQKEFDARRQGLERQMAELIAQREREFEARRVELQRELDEVEARRVAELAERERIFEERRQAARSVVEKQIIEREEAFARREEELADRERALNATIAEREREVLADLTRRQAELDQREQDIEARLRELDEAARHAAQWADEQLEARRKEIEQHAAAELARRQADLEQSMNARLADAELDLAARDSEYRSRVEAMTAREAEVERLAEEFRARDGEIDKRHAALDAREQELLRKFDDHVQRDSELAQLAATLESRNTRLVEWQKRIESEQAALDAHRDEAERARGAILLRQQEIDQRAAELEARFAELLSNRTGLKTERELLDTRVMEVESREAQLRKREEQLERSREELADDERRLNDSREEVRLINEKLKLVDERGAELEALSETLGNRERLLAERVSIHEQQIEEFDRTRREVESLRVRLDAERRDLEEKAHALDERMARAETVEQRAREAKAQLDRERTEIEESRAAVEARSASLDQQSQRIAAQLASIDAQREAVVAQEERLLAREQDLNREKADHAAAMDRLTADRAALELFKSHVDEQQAAFARDQAAFNSRLSEFEAERARLDREKLMHRDRDRDLTGERADVESARAEMERLQAELKAGIDENVFIKRQLMETRDRLRSRKRRLIDDVARIEERRRQLEAELEQVRKLRAKADADTATLTEERRKFETERAAHLAERDELEQTRRTFQAGVREVEGREKVLTDREMELADHARKLEEYRARLEEEYGDIDKQRQQLLDAQEKGGAETQRLSVLMEQSEAMRQELRAREEDLATLEKALAARSAELTRSEEEVRRKAAEFDDRQSSIEEARKQLERERNALAESIETQRDDVETQRRQAEAKIAEQQAILQRRMKEFEAEMAAQREALEAEEREHERGYAAEVRQRVESEMADRLTTAREREEEVERRCKARLEEVERDIHDRLARFEEEIRGRRAAIELDVAQRLTAPAGADNGEMQARWEAQLAELRTRQEALAKEHAGLREQRDALEAERRAFDIQRRAAAAEPEILEDADIDREAMQAVIESRQRELDERERHLEDRERRLESVESAGPAGMPFTSPSFGGLSTQADTAFAADAEPAVAVADAEPEISRRVAFAPPRRPSLALTAGVAVALGLISSVAVYNLTAGDRTVRAFVQMDAKAPSSMCGLEVQGPVLSRAISAARTNFKEDLTALPERDAIEIALDEPNRRIKLSVKSGASSVPLAQRWLEAVGAAYTAEVRAEAASQQQVSHRLQELKDTRAAKQAAVQEARSKLAEVQQALAADPQVREVERTQAELKRQLDDANAAVAAAQKALDDAEARPISDAPITPSETQRMAVYKADAQLAQSMEQRAMFAREFHLQLVKAFESSTAPLTTFSASIDGLRKQIDSQRKDQRDRDILSQLEQIAVGVSDLRDFTQKFTAAFNDLSPKVTRWKDGGDVDLLTEYQRAAEDLVRQFDADTRTTLTQIAKDIDSLTLGGSEPTQRSVIQRMLKTTAHNAAVALRDLLLAAAGVVKENNKELLTLRRSIKNLSEGINQKQAAHDESLIKNLTAIRADERSRALAALRETLNQAVQRKDQATTAFVTQVEQAIKSDRTASERIAALRAKSDEQANRLRDAEKDLVALDAEMATIQKEGRTALADLAAFKVDTAAGANGLDRNRAIKAGGIGGGVALLYLGAFWLMMGLGGKRQ